MSNTGMPPNACQDESWLPLRVLILATMALLGSARTYGQAIYGSINGTVADPSGAAIVDATVTLTDANKGTAKTRQTGSNGEYNFQQLIPDPYLVKVEAKGFSKAVSEAINLSADSSRRMDFQLKVGASTQTVEVTAQGPTLTTDRADVSTVLDSLTVEQTPNLIRNVTSLVLLAPGTTASTFSNANAEDPQRSIPIAANGQSPFSSGFILDGANDKDSFIGEAVVNPPLDSIQEVKFINQDYDAEFGAAIAGVTVMQTKSGSNSFHGSAYDFRRSDAQQARDPFTQYPGNNPVGPDVPHTLSNILACPLAVRFAKTSCSFSVTIKAPARSWATPSSKRSRQRRCTTPALGLGPGIAISANTSRADRIRSMIPPKAR